MGLLGVWPVSHRMGLSQFFILNIFSFYFDIIEGDPINSKQEH